MLQRVIFVFILFSVALVSCDKLEKFKHTDSRVVNDTSSVYHINTVHKDIYNLLNKGDKASLVQFLEQSSAEERAAVLNALAVLADSNDIYVITQYLQDSSELVRLSSAFALGNIGSPLAQDYLIKQYYNEKSSLVRAEILKAIGACGSSRGLYFLSKLTPNYSDTIELKGLAYGLVKFSLRRKISNDATNQALALLTSPLSPVSVKRIISYYFTNPELEAKSYYRGLLNEFNQCSDLYVKANLLTSFGKVRTPEVRQHVLSALASEDEYLRTAAMQVYTKFYATDADIVKYLNDNSVQVSRLAAEYYIYNGKQEDALTYFDLAKNVHNWQARSLMFHAALKYSPDSMRSIIAHSIITGYKAAENRYEKSSLLAALSYDPLQYSFVRDQTFYSTDRVVATSGIKALVKMRLNPNFAHFAKLAEQSQRDNLYEEFALIFKEAMRKGDNAMIFYASKVLANKSLNIVNPYENTFFIQQALSKLQLPRDIRVYKSVCKLLYSYNGQSCETPNVELSKVNWHALEHAEPNQRVIVKTSKGNFIIRLNTEQAPAASSAFIDLISQHYYDNIFVFRRVPNKMLMFSSRRGDLWQDQNIVNRLNLYPSHFEPGSVAMQLVDGKLESVQWFVSLSYLPQLDGKFTIFGKVISGMDVVRTLQVSDQIYSVELL